MQLFKLVLFEFFYVLLPYFEEFFKQSLSEIGYTYWYDSDNQMAKCW